jgi:hypothetical protein
LDPFAGPEFPELALEVDPNDRARSVRTPRAAAYPTRAPVAAKPSPLRLIIAIAIVVVGVAGYVVYDRYRARGTPDDPVRTIPGGGVTIRVEAEGAPEIRIDGKPAGRAPIALQLPVGVTVTKATGSHLSK